MENLPRNPQGHPPASHMLDDLLSLLVDLDVASHPGAAKSHPSTPIPPATASNSDRPSISDPNSDESYSSDHEHNSSSQISNLITAHRQSLLKSLSLPIPPTPSSSPSASSIPSNYNPPSNLATNNLATPPTPKNLPEVQPQTSHPETNHNGVVQNGVNHARTSYSETNYSGVSSSGVDYTLRIDRPINSQPIAVEKNNNGKVLPEVDSENIHAQTSSSEINHRAVDRSLDINDIDNSEAVFTGVNNPQINNPQISNLIVINPEVINPEVINPEVINLKGKPVAIPETNGASTVENSYSQSSDHLIHLQTDHSEATSFNVNHSIFNNSPNSRTSDSGSGLNGNSPNNSRSSHAQSLHLANNETKATINGLGLLMDSVLNADTSSPGQAVEATIVPNSEPTEEPVEAVEEDEDPLNILQRLLVNPDVYDSQKLLQRLEVSLKKLESQIYEPEKLIELLLPTIAELLSLKISQSKEEVVEAITPIIDEVIQHRIEQDRVAMSGAIAPIISEAISKQIVDSPEEIANAIGPTMGKAIQEQIRLEKDSMVDALYPIIGTTISKYMGEAIANINRQVETAFSAEGLKRKVQAKMQGVSEAELILREALPFNVLAAFLIHKNSGLLIADAQPPQEEQLEADMIAGMLTAIRSFANDCMASSSKNSSELNQIDYSDSKIVLEVAGYCYLALVVKGQMTEGFVKKFRRSMATIVRIYNKPIMNFDGDRSTIPEEVNTLIEDMLVYHDPNAIPTSKYPWTLGLVILGIFSVIAIPLGIYQYRQSINYQIAQQVTTALDKTPELSVYRLEAQVVDDQVQLIGKVPNATLQNRAGEIAKQNSSKLAIDNQIIAIDIPIDPSFTATEIQRTTTVLNKIPGIMISSKYESGILEMNGMVKDRESIENITKAMRNIPGIKVLSNQIQLGNINQAGISQRIYFDPGSANVPPASLPQITEIKKLLDLNPSFRLRITGYTDPTGSIEENQRLATARATNIQQVFLDQGIEQKQLEARGSTNRVPDAVELWQSRFVEFELIAPNIQN